MDAIALRSRPSDRSIPVERCWTRAAVAVSLSYILSSRATTVRSLCLLRLHTITARIDPVPPLLSQHFLASPIVSHVGSLSTTPAVISTVFLYSARGCEPVIWRSSSKCWRAVSCCCCRSLRLLWLVWGRAMPHTTSAAGRPPSCCASTTSTPQLSANHRPTEHSPPPTVAATMHECNLFVTHSDCVCTVAAAL